MAKKKTNTDEPDKKPKRQTKKVIASQKDAKPKRKKSTIKEIEKPVDEPVAVAQPDKIDWSDSIHPFKLSDYYTEDEGEINLMTLLDMLSESENDECDFELDDDVAPTSMDEDDPWLSEIEARFDSIVDPILAKYEAIEQD